MGTGFAPESRKQETEGWKTGRLMGGRGGGLEEGSGEQRGRKQEAYLKTSEDKQFLRTDRTA